MLIVQGVERIMAIQSSLRSSFALHREDRSKQQKDEYTLTIGDLAREFGVTLRTLRFYEDRGLLSPRRSGTTRHYSQRDRARLSVILKGKQLGFTLTEIRAMVAEDRSLDEPAAKLEMSLAQIEDQISHLEAQRKEIDDALEELRGRRQSMMVGT